MKNAKGSEGVSRRRFIALGASGIAMVGTGGRASGAEAPSRKYRQEMEETPFTMSWPIKWQDYAPDATFAKLLTLLQKFRAVIDEVSLYDAPTQMSWFAPLTEWSNTTQLMQRRFETLRRVGIRSLGIYATMTLGHGGENLEGAPKLPFPPMVDIGGAESLSSPCPSRSEFLAYTRERYKLFARAAPHFILLCDDIRMQGHGGIEWGCFCPVCLQLFAEQVGRTYSREALAGALDAPQSKGLREAWVERNARAVESIYATVGAAIKETSPQVRIGAETLGMAYAGYNGSAFERWFGALRATIGRTNTGSFYYDTSIGRGIEPTRMAVLAKQMDVSRQLELYPAQVRTRQWECETWPGGALVKEPRSAVNECVAAIMTGCNSIGVNTLGWSAPFDEYASLFSELVGARAYLNDLLRHVEGLAATGLGVGWSPQTFAGRDLRAGESWLSGRSDLFYSLSLPATLSQVGLPLCARRDTPGFVLAGRTPELLSEVELRSILSTGVLMDAIALRVLTERGLDTLAGVKIATANVNTAMARLTDDPLNGPYNNAASWTMVPAGFEPVTLSATAAGVRWITELQNSPGKAIGPCTSCFENPLGGRVVVAGFSPWWYQQFASRRYQLLAIADWITRDKLPVRILEPVQLTPYVRINEAGTKGAIALYNTGLSPIESVTVAIRAQPRLPVHLISPKVGPGMKRIQQADWWGVIVSHIPAWSTVSLLLG